MLYEEEKAFNMFVRPQPDTQCVLVRNTMETGTNRD